MTPDVFSMRQIAVVSCPLPTKFGVPRQSGLAGHLTGEIRFFPAFSDPNIIRGLSDFSHLWVLWRFSDLPEKAFTPTVRPPRLGGNKRMGVFATRSPFRPNPIGLSVVRLEKAGRQDGCIVLTVSGLDMADGTPVYDIKPYLPYVDSIPTATGGFTEQSRHHLLSVHLPEDLAARLPDENSRQALSELLANDPRPAYQNDPLRRYGLTFSGFEVHFSVQGEQLTVLDITKAAAK